MYITPTFHFNGQCEEAIELYRKAFDCEVKCKMYYKDADSSDMDITRLTEKEKKYIYHSEVVIGGQIIRMSDEAGLENACTMSLFLAVNFDTIAETQRAFEVLKEAGTVLVPLHSTAYSPCYGSLIDKYGFRWVLMV